jgi:hypothetical protein
MKKTMAALTAAFVLFCCASVLSATGDEREFVRISPDGSGFIVSGRPWYPFGCNYFDPDVGWPPRLWQRFDPEKVESHFRVMRELGVNVVRVFLTAQSFFPEPPNLEPTALEKFEKMLSIARRNGIRLHPTGPDHWEGNPGWRRTDFIADPRALEVQVAFWKAFAARYCNEPVIFAYDILNEPHVGWNTPAMKAQWPKWLREQYGTLEALRKAWGKEAQGVESFEEIEVPADTPALGSRLLLDYQHFRESVAERWLRIQAEAIRAVAPNHLVTVGLIQWTIPVLYGKPSRYAAFRPSRIAPALDFLSVHFYPFYGGDPTLSDENFEKNLAYLELALRYVKAGAPRKPLVVGEFGWHDGKNQEHPVERSAEDQSRWCRSAVMQGRGIAAGWLNWAYADTPSARDLTKFSGLVTEQGKTKPWGLAFRHLAGSPKLWTESPVEPEAIVDFHLDRAITDPRAGDAMLGKYYEAWRLRKACGLKVR